MFPLRDGDSPHHCGRPQQLFLPCVPARAAKFSDAFKKS